MIELTQDTFDQQISNGHVLVDFFADWCGPCQQLKPTLEKMNEEYKHKITIASVNVDDQKSLAEKYQVRGIPCMIFFRDGKEHDRVVGALSEEKLRSKVDDVLAQ